MGKNTWEKNEWKFKLPKKKLLKILITGTFSSQNEKMDIWNIMLHLVSVPIKRMKKT